MKLAEHYAHNYFDMHETNNFKALKKGFSAGFNTAIEKFNEYLFNTENHPNNISEDYLKQTIGFLIELKDEQ